LSLVATTHFEKTVGTTTVLSFMLACNEHRHPELTIQLLPALPVSRIVRAIQNGKQHLLANEHLLAGAPVHMLLHRHAELLLLDYPSMQFKRHPAAFLDQVGAVQGTDYSATITCKHALGKLADHLVPGMY